MAYLERIEQFGSTWYGLALLLAVPLAVVFAPLLLGEQVPAWGDDVIQAAPYFAFWNRAIHAGQESLWNPLNVAGYPAYATAFGFFAPWNRIIAASLTTTAAAIRVLPWLTAVAFVFGAFFTFKLLREFGVSFWPSYLAATAYTFSHQTDAFLPVVTYVHFFFPLALFLVWRLEQSRSVGWVAAGAAAVGAAWLSINFQEMLYILVALGVFAAFLAVRRWRRGDRRHATFFLLRVAAAVLFGVIIGLIQILPSVVMAELSTRAGGTSYAFAAEDAVLPSDFLRYLIPDVKLPQGIPFGSRGSTTVFYMGIVPLFFFLAGFAVRTPLARFFQALYGGILATAIVFSPIFFVLHRLPLFSYFRVPDRWMFIATFAAIVLAALGVEAFLAAKRRGELIGWRRFLSVFVITTGAILLAVIALNGVLWLFEAKAIALLKSFFALRLYDSYQPEGAVPVEHYFGIIERYFGDLHQYFSLANPLVATAALAIAASWAALWLAIRRWHWQLAAPALALVTVLNFIAVKPFDYTTIPAAVHQEVPPTIRFLQENPGRAMPFLYETFEEKVARPVYGLRGEDGLRYRLAMLVPNTNLFYGIESAIIKDGLEPMAISRLMSLVGAPVIGISREFPHNDPEAAANTLVERKPLLDFLGIRYIVSGYPLDAAVFPVALQVDVTSKRIPITIYENREAKPLVWLAPKAQFLRADTEAIFQAYRDAGFQGVFSDCPASCPPGGYLFGNGSAELLAQGNGRALVRTSLAVAPGFLVFSQNNLPGWRASIDGVEAQRYTVNSVFIGIVVPVGEHEVEFRYENPCSGWSMFQCLRAAMGLS